MSTINWAQYIKQAEEAGESLDEYTPLPEDSYDVKVLKAEATKTKKTPAKDMIKITWVVEGGPYSGRRVWSNMVVSPESPKAMAILIRQLTALGVRPLLEQGASFEQIAGALTNTLATVKVTVGEYQGKPKNEVTSIAARQGGQAGPNIPGSALGTGADLPI